MAAGTRHDGADLVTTVHIRNVGRGGTPALFTRADVFSGKDQVLPVRWSDNDVTLWPGEEIGTVPAAHRCRSRSIAAPSLRNA